jgi:adenylate cyclase
MGVLQSVSGSQKAALLPTTRVGRGPKSDLRLTDGDVSTNQAVFEWNGDHWVVRDAGSKNGTMVDGKVLREGDSAHLQSGSVVVFATEQAWKLVDADAPAWPFAIPLAGGDALQADGGVLTLPAEGPPEVRITLEGAHFLTQTGRGPVRIDDGEVLVAAGRSYRIMLPPKR